MHVRGVLHCSCGLVVSIGGGSALDTGKAVAAMLTNGGDPLQYLEVCATWTVLSLPNWTSGLRVFISSTQDCDPLYQCKFYLMWPFWDVLWNVEQQIVDSTFTNSWIGFLTTSAHFLERMCWVIWMHAGVTTGQVVGEGKPLTRPGAPFIACPTTAGVGAEVQVLVTCTFVFRRGSPVVLLHGYHS